MVITISRETGSGGHTIGKIILNAIQKYNGGKNNA